MAVIENFNRVISIYLYPQVKNADGSLSKGPVDMSASIICPETGRKPNISINGLSTANDSVPMFNISIKNLYMDDLASKYPYIDVVAGYQGKTQRFEGYILYAFTESPGPEGNTVIQCLQTSNSRWLASVIRLNLKEGYSFEDAINALASNLGAKPHVSENLKSLTSTESFIFTGKTKDAIVALKNHYTQDINIKLVGDTLVADIFEESTDDAPIKVPFVTAPVQLIGGGENSVLATVQTLWNPEVTPGKKLEFNSSYYSTNKIMRNNKDKLIMKVNTVQFQFSTKNGNQMTVTGQVL